MNIIDKRTKAQTELFLLDTGTGFMYKNELYILITPKGETTNYYNKVVLNCQTNELIELNGRTRVELVDITITIKNYEMLTL